MEPNDTPPSMDWTDCPLVEINPRKMSGAAVLKGTRMPADDVIENIRGGSTVEEIAEDFDLEPGSIRDLLVYVAKHNPAPQS